MTSQGFATAPARASYDVVIVGGAIYGSAVAWFLVSDPDFDGRILVVERDPSYAQASTSHTNSCLRQQFSQEINVRVSQFAAEYVKSFREQMGGDPRVPQPTLQSFGYLYLADTPAFADHLKAAQRLQASLGAGTRIMSVEEVAAAYPFYALDDILLASHNTKDEGYFEGAALFDWWKRKAREAGVEYVAQEVVGLDLDAAGARVERVRLSGGESVACGALVNASGPRAAATTKMAGIEIPVEPRKRFSFVFAAERPLDLPLPLTIDPSGVHVRSEGAYYLAGCPPERDGPVDYDDFAMDHALWEEKVWPALARRIPAFEAIKQLNAWAGHYAFNTFDQNAIVGPHDRVANFYFVNGFSGHGLQQSPAIGRGLAELLVHGAYRSLDLSAFGYRRLVENRPFVEAAVI